MISDIIQDKDGFYWIGTSEGLNRFDGSTFKVYRHDKNGSTSRSSNDDGNIWMAAFGLWKINPAKETIASFCFNESDNVSISDASQLHSVYFDTNRNGLWILTWIFRTKCATRTGNVKRYC